MRIGLKALVTVPAVLAAVAVATPAQAAPIVLAEGHVDVVDVAYEGGQLEIAIHDEETDTEYEPSEVLLVAKKESATPVPTDPAFSFLGAPGATVYVLPDTETEGLLFPGLAAEEVESGVFLNDQVTIRFKQVVGPDGFSLFGYNPDGSPNKRVDSEDGLPDSIVLGAGAHAHTNWAFEKAGKYWIKVDATAKLASTGATVTSPATWLTFRVDKN